ncbi:MAG: DUF5678 domain-containing protein [Cyanobacteria bacterium J06634_6]
MMTKEELEKYSKYIDRDRLEYIERQGQLYEEAKPALLKKYLGEYVAFEDGKVLDHDTDRQALARRVYEKYGYRDLIMQKVAVEEPVYYVGRFPHSCCVASTVNSFYALD